MKNTANFIPTATGGRFYFDDIMANDIDIEDIAIHLSKICRFSGACKGHYSVAEHSVLVSHIVPNHLALAALLHDAPEAYLNDLTRPVKSKCDDYIRLERMVTLLIDNHFGVWTSHEEIKKADSKALYAEALEFFGVDEIADWGFSEEFICNDIPLIRAKSHDAAAELFLLRFKELSLLKHMSKKGS